MAEQLVVAAPAFFDASGRLVTDRATHQAARLGSFRTAIAFLELHGVPGTPEQGRAVVFEIQLTVNPNVYPFLVLDGAIGGDICTEIGTQWVVTGGSLGQTLVLEAKRLPLGNAPPNTELVTSCAHTLSISGVFQPPDSYAGAYGSDGSNSDFAHTTLFKGWQTSL
jgi:hypothetical protein